MTEREKMLAGELYDPLDPELLAARTRARELCWKLNASPEPDRAILQQLFGRGGDSVWMQPPFFCDYGTNIDLGERVFFNFNCVGVRIGSPRSSAPAVSSCATFRTACSRPATPAGWFASSCSVGLRPTSPGGR